MKVGRPQKVQPGTLYAFAHQFYWDFRQIAEGYTLNRFDENKYEMLTTRIRTKKLHLTPEQATRINVLAEEEIRRGRLKKAKKKDWLREAEESQLCAQREWHEQLAAEKATNRLLMPGDSDLIGRLLKAETPQQIRRICADASLLGNPQLLPGESRIVRVPNWPISMGSVLPSNLSQYAAEFIEARKDPRFPQSNNRPTTRLKQLWFLSRALAGALYGVKARTAINLVGSARPEQVFKNSRDAKPRRKRGKRRGL